MDAIAASEGSATGLAGGDGGSEGLTPVRAFPLSAPDQGVALVDDQGREVRWIERLESLSTQERQQIDALLAPRSFRPVITRLVAVSSFTTPCNWQVETDRGTTQFTLKSEDDIRRLPDGRLLIAAEGGLQLELREVARLDKQSRKLLARFL